eukprot:2406987-Rhodomonas_salina.1
MLAASQGHVEVAQKLLRLALGADKTKRDTHSQAGEAMNFELHQAADHERGQTGRDATVEMLASARASGPGFK